jgi:hypothetical protein
MKNFFVITVATAIAFGSVLFAKDAYDKYMLSQAMAEATEVVEEVVEAKLRDDITAMLDKEAELDSWHINDDTNSVTGDRAITAMKLSNDREGFVVFRCYDKPFGGERKFDMFFSFPESVELNTETFSAGYAMLSYRLDSGETSPISMQKSISSRSVMPSLTGERIVESVLSMANEKMKTRSGITMRNMIAQKDAAKYAALPAKPDSYLNEMMNSNLIELSAPSGEISQQVMSIDIAGLAQHAKPVFEYCSRKNIIVAGK